MQLCFYKGFTCVLYVAIHTDATGMHKAATNLPAHYSEDHDVKECYRCSSQYSFSKHGACITCYPRDQCSNPKCTELAYCDKDLSSFNYCSRECRDECELKGANEQLRRALKEFEVVPGLQTASRAQEGRNGDKKIHGHGVENTYIVRGVTDIIGTPPYASSRNNPSTPHTISSTGSSQSSPHTTSNMSVGSASQPTTSTRTIMPQSDTKSTIPAIPPIVISHRQSTQTCTSQPQSKIQFEISCPE